MSTNNPLSYTDPSGMFIQPSDPGSGGGDPSGIIGALVQLGEFLAGLFGGGGPSSIPSALVTPSSPIYAATDDQCPNGDCNPPVAVGPGRSLQDLFGMPKFFALGTAKRPKDPKTGSGSPQGKHLSSGRLNLFGISYVSAHGCGCRYRGVLWSHGHVARRTHREYVRLWWHGLVCSLNQELVCRTYVHVWPWHPRRRGGQLQSGRCS